MKSLNEELQIKKNTLNEFYVISRRILNYLPDIVSGYSDKNKYRIYKSEVAGTIKYVRPINKSLFYFDINEFEKNFKLLLEIFKEIKSGNTPSKDQKHIIDRTLYTIQQSIGAGLDLLVNPNSARKHVGNRFEELIKAVFNELGVVNKKVVFKIPYETEDGDKIYRSETDLIISKYNNVKSSSENINENEVILSIKTTSKDRMGKIFIDKILLENFSNKKLKIVGVFLNDVQRKKEDNIGYTLVAGLFMVYTKFLTKLDGIYYLDLPPHSKKEPYSRYLKPFSELIINDIHKLIP